MPTLILNKKQERVNFLISRELSERLTWAEKEFDFSRSDLIRRALQYFLVVLEKEKADREIEEACKFYYEKDKKLAAEWRAAEGPV